MTMTDHRFCRVPPAPAPDFACLASAVSERDDNHECGMGALQFPAGLVERAAAQTSKLWKPGRTLRVRYLGGSRSARAAADAGFSAWEPHVGLTFRVARPGEPAEIRVAFDPAHGSLSYLGTDALVVPQARPTMNLGWVDASTAMHEVGHALGLIHEHSNPLGNIPWDVEAVYRDYAGPPNRWDRATVRSNVLAVYDARLLTNGGFDPQSVMLYPIPPKHLTDPSRAVGWNKALSAGDKAFAAKVYPKLGLAGAAERELKRLLGK